jgi:predicted nucleotidyltransferase/plasmid maintenance system antidote protein VapI
LTIFVKNILFKMESFGGIIRELRIEKKLPLRTVAAYLDIDQAILSKIERGQRKASRDIVVKTATFFKTDMNRLLLAWLSDNLVYQLKDEEIAIKALQVAEDKVFYQRRKKTDRGTIIKVICDFFKEDGRISKAWVFGSFARGEDKQDSDIDLMISYSDKATGTLLDYADIKNRLENLLNRNIDVVEEGYVKSFIIESVNRDKVQIYG